MWSDSGTMKKWLIIGVLAGAIVGMVSPCLAQTGFAQTDDQSLAGNRSLVEPLRTFLQGYLNIEQEHPDRTTRVTLASVTSQNSGVTHIVVYISGLRWCGTGGCTLLILETDSRTYRVLGKVTVVRLPIRILTSSRGGHPDFGVRVHNDATQSGYDAAISFDGVSYTPNPSLPSVRRLRGGQGKIIISRTNMSVPLYR
jgi:hypothetical protein